MKFSELVEINPPISLSRAKEHFYIEMRDMEPARRYAYPQRKRPLQGGSRFEEGDTLFARISPCTEKGNINQASGLNGEPGYGSTEFLVFRAKPGVSQQDFVLYFSKWNEIKDYAANNLQGTSGRQRVAKEAFDELEVIVPEPDEQRTIASVLSSLDAKIDLLHRQNKTLEAMAETLFRQWFVEEAEEGWIKRPLSSIATYLNGVACQKYPAKDAVNRLPVLKIKELSAGITDSSDWATSAIDSKYHVEAGDVVFSWSATLMVKLWDGPKAILNQHLFKVTSEEFPKWFYFMWTKHYVVEFVSIAESHATTFGHIKRGDLDEAMVLVPSSERLNEMTLVMEPLFGKHITNSAQIKSLTALRDTLLPKLMSGEVRVEGVVKSIEEAKA